MGSLFFRKCLAWLVVAFFYLLLPTFGHANIALTGKSFQAVIQGETIMGYEAAMKPVLGQPGGTYYNYSSNPVYYDPYKPEVARTLKSVSSADGVKYPSKVKVKDLLSMKDINGKKIFIVPAEGTYTGMTSASGIAKKALTGLPGLLLSELVFPETLADGTISASGYELGKLSDSTDINIIPEEIRKRIAKNHGIDVSEGILSIHELLNPQVYTDGIFNIDTVLPGDANSPSYIIHSITAWQNFGLDWYDGPKHFLTHFSYDSNGKLTSFRENKAVFYQTSRYYLWGRYIYCHSSSNPYPGGFDPSLHPELYSGTEGKFNALADLIASDAEVELIPLDPALMPTYFPDGDTGFMRFGGHTQIADDGYLIGPDYTAVLNPPGVTWGGGIPYIDPASIGYLADPVAPGGQTSIIPGSITGIPPGSTILSVDPQTGLIRFRTPEGSESSKFGTTAEIQNLQLKVSSPYLDANGQPMTYGSSSSNSTGGNSTTTTKVITDREDYSVTVPGLPGVPNFISDFEVPEPEPWPWQQWVANPIKTILDNMAITASGSPLLNFVIDFPWYQPINLTVNFAEYETEISSMGGYMVALAYIMAVLVVVRAKN